MFARRIEEADIFDLPQIPRQPPAQFGLKLRYRFDGGLGDLVGERGLRPHHVGFRNVPINETEDGRSRKRDDKSKDHGQAKGRGTEEFTDLHAA